VINLCDVRGFIVRDGAVHVCQYRILCKMPSIAIGTNIDGPNREPFKINDFLGNGAFGEVYRAVGESSGAVVAVKLLPVGILESADSKIALLNEIRVAQRVKHPNVVQVLYVEDGTTSSTGPYVFMEYVSGGTLAKLIHIQKQSGTLIPLNRSVEMMIDIAQGARAINETIIHRDIKPDNILIEGQQLKIGDFGISKFVDEGTRLHTFKGGQHLAYMAPEGWQNQTNTFKLDVYSVGLLFYQILTLEHPLASKVKDPSSFLDWEKVHLYQPCPDVRTLRKETPLSIAQLLTRMVSKRPNDRPEWNEVLQIVSKPDNSLSTPEHPSVRAAVEAIVERRREQEEKQLAARQQEDERTRQLGLYQYSCSTLLKDLAPIVDQFNQHSQHGSITSAEELGFTFFRVPLGRTIEVGFFEPRNSGIKIRGGEIVGGGWIGVSQGRSANLVLLKQGPDDLYGRWIICEVNIMALEDPQALIGRFGLTARTVTPFGFKDAYFYDQIRYATGGMHVFTYHFVDDVPNYFADLLLEACK
jgi:eukaryotic-like serine/threonine-protein kinase